VNALLSLLLTTAHVPASQLPHDWLFQGRFSVAERIKQHAERCGIRNVELEVARGALTFHSPEEAGAELTIPAAEMTKAAKACMAPYIKDGDGRFAS
jgi:hypothetical protein